MSRPFGAAALVLGFLGVCLGAFAIYTFGYRGSDERSRAELDAKQVESTGDVGSLVSVGPVGGGFWRATFAKQNGNKDCVLLDLRKFDVVVESAGGWQMHGAGTTTCP